MKFYLNSLWHGLAQAVLTAGSVIIALQGWPTTWSWLVIGVGAAMAFVKGVEGYTRNPDA